MIGSYILHTGFSHFFYAFWIVCNIFKYADDFFCFVIYEAILFPDFVTVSPKNHQRTKVRSFDAVS